MSRFSWIFWTTFVTGSIIYAMMVFWSLPYISREADGLPPFDLRPGGYSLEEANAFLTALSKEGRDFYRNVQHEFDLVYPALLAIALASGSLLVSPPAWTRWRWLLAILPLPGMIFDYRENWLVGRLLDAPAPSNDVALVAASSNATILKSIATAVAMTAFLVLLVLWVMRRWRSTS